MAKKKNSYIIGPIGSEGSETRAWADFLKEYILTPAVTQCGYNKPERSEKDFGQELIPIGILDKLLEADLVIADLTGGNRNVFFELGIRHCVKKAVIHVLKWGEKLPFDLSTNRTIFVGIDPKRVEQAKEEISQRIKHIEKDPQQFYSYIQLREIYKLTPKEETKEQTRIERRLDFIEQTLQGMLKQLERPIMGGYPNLSSVFEMQERRDFLKGGTWPQEGFELMDPSDIIKYSDTKPPSGSIEVEPAGD